MGIDASYVIPYKRGLLKKIQEEIKKGQYYYCQGEINTYGLTRDYEEKSHEIYGTDFIFHLKRKDETYCGSRIVFYPRLGILEVDDGRRYSGSHNIKWNEGAIEYYENLLKSMGHYRYYCYIHSDICGSVHNDETFNSYADELTDDEVLQEIPPHLLTDHEKNILMSVYGKIVGIDEKPTALVDIIRKGETVLLKEKIETMTEKEIEEALLYACKAKSAYCLDVLLQKMKASPEFFDICVRNKDRASCQMILATNYTPTIKQIYESTKYLDQEIFEFCLCNIVKKAYTLKDKWEDMSCKELDKIYEDYGNVLFQRIK
jgi:hypothetical protein